MTMLIFIVLIFENNNLYNTISEMRKLIFILFLLLLPSESNAQQSGTIRGIVSNSENKLPIKDAIVEIIGGEVSTTNSKGEFNFEGLELKTYQLKVSFIGFSTVIKTDIVVDASKPASVLIELNPTTLTIEEIEIISSYFQKDPSINISSQNLDFEEVRRAPGAVEDIGRMLQSSPGISINNDQRNDLIVRGGSPSENLILIDGIEVPNFNHFGSQGSTGGPVSLINLKFMESADIFIGGFPSLYGDRLSSVVDLKFREGSTKNYHNNIDLSLSGFGGTFEGPLSSKTSYLFSIKRSFLDFLKDAIRLTSVPVYWSTNYKLTHKIDSKNKLSFIGFGALDKIDFSSQDVDDEEIDYYGDTKVERKVFTTGLNYTKLVNKGYFESILSINYLNDEILSPKNDGTGLEFLIHANEVILNLAISYNHQLSKHFTLKSGIGSKYINSQNDLFYTRRNTATGYHIPEQNSDITIKSYKLNGYTNFTGKFFEETLTLNIGARIDHFEYLKLKTNFSPRAGLSLNLSPSTKFNLAYGIYYQNPEYIWLASHELNYNLNSIRSDHYIAGIEQFIDKNIRITGEVYYKKYKDYPVSYDNPAYILVNGGSAYGPNLIGRGISTGRGNVYGFDFSIQKKLVGNGLYGQINYSYINTKFTAEVGGEVPNNFDQTHQATIILGYQVSSDWLFGMKLKYATGKPYSPFDLEKSYHFNQSFYDMDYYNQYRLPDYVRFDIRVDKKFNFDKITLVTYLEIQNLFNRDNIVGYVWDSSKNRPATAYHWAFFPIGGVSFQF